MFLNFHNFELKVILREGSLSLTDTGAEANLQGYENFLRLFVGVRPVDTGGAGGNTPNNLPNLILEML